MAAVVTGLVAGLALDRLGHGLLLALALWIGFPVVLLAGSVFHERVPPLLAAIHTRRHLEEITRRYLPPDQVAGYLAMAEAEHGEQVVVHLRPDRWLSADLG